MGGDECNQVVESQEEVAAQVFRVKHKLEALLHLQQELGHVHRIDTKVEEVCVVLDELGAQMRAER
ncbi:hypothetical protein BconGalA64_34780 [Burkholderia contaminans]|nr:hypothetical protein BconGalA64_34780 [Burkholderia contaminans]